ncbi:ABC transporter ATP-binding protein [Eubacteriales bacterium OttesenSCG-928-K08]|nr:ABC transporter ATP-binding protein [Eubacteriales bacterium OttesenSCG-928-K08]
MSQPLLETKNLKKYFKTPHGNLHAVDDVSLSIEKGATLGVVGESGCGKSTLGRTILRLTQATDGRILYDGREIQACNESEMRLLRREMQIIFQDPFSSLNPRLTVNELIAEPIIVNHICENKAARNRRVEELMDMVELAKRLSNTYPHELDGGRRQRIGIARALALNPRFIVCDEPVSALDVSVQAQVLNLLMDLQERLSLTYLFITHNLSVVRHISSEIAVMYMGVCVEKAPANMLFSHPRHPYTEALLEAIPTPDLSSRNKKRKILKGEVASPINPAPGCRFAPRCTKATAACTENGGITFSEVEKGHFVACIHCC